MTIQLWLDDAELTYSEFSFLSYVADNPTEHFADNLLFFNRPPKADTFQGRLDLDLSLRLIFQEQETPFSYKQSNVSISGKVSHIKCRGGKVTQTQLMAEWLELLADNRRDDMTLLRYPIEGRYTVKEASIDLDKLHDKAKSLANFGDFNPHFFRLEVQRIILDPRFWARPKLKFKGNFPTTCYLPSEKQI